MENNNLSAYNGFLTSEKLQFVYRDIKLTSINKQELYQTINLNKCATWWPNHDIFESPITGEMD